ncbi:MAG: DUF167 domain-containing protein [Candidatus Pacebacteria bacterium]|nr:DUF167 domain-containing protein [Candidatus Paceibacterota bacterium]
MRITIKVKPNARETKIEPLGGNVYKVSVKEPPKESRANYAVLEALAEYFDVGISHVRIVSGLTAKNKIVEII